MATKEIPKEVPLRVDFAGGWLDVPRFAKLGGYVVNCAIHPLVSLEKWEYEKQSGLGGSAAWAMLMGNDPLHTELGAGVGWQDPAILQETGLCVWKSGQLPELEAKVNPVFLSGNMALYWTGKIHSTRDIADFPRDYELIYRASIVAAKAIHNRNIGELWEAVRLSYQAQLNEGMDSLPDCGEIAKKYCGSGWGGYAVYIFNQEEVRNEFLAQKNTKRIEPFILL